jgi:hypothetical protein
MGFEFLVISSFGSTAVLQIKITLYMLLSSSSTVPTPPPLF